MTAHEIEADEVDLTDTAHVTWREWPTTNSYVTNDEGKVACRIYKTIRARRLWA